MPADKLSAQAAEMCQAIQAVDNSLAQMALEDLPQDDEEQQESIVTETKSKRSWFGKVGKGLMKRVGNLRGSDKMNTEELEDVKAKILACRSPFAHKDGGIAAADPEEPKMARSVLGLMIRQMGRNLLQGGKVMNTSFPIQCCQPQTVLEIAQQQGRYMHAFLPRAANTSDPVERMKNVVSCFVAAMTLTSGNFLKPLNPVLGETLQTEYSDGAKLYMEQTCHHPPVSSFSLEGPGGLYQYYGYTTFDIGFGYNKMNINTKGLRICKFKDGGVIEIGFPEDRVSNVFWGEMHHESLGSQEFVDKANGVRCVINYGGSKGLPSDYFTGSIEKFNASQPQEEGETICSVEGSWVGFCDFDKVRYWDMRNCSKLGLIEPTSTLASDSRKRQDRNLLAKKDYENAQTEKLRLEEIQRGERKLREAVHGKHK